MTENGNGKADESCSVGDVSESVPVPNGVEEPSSDTGTSVSASVDGGRRVAVEHISSAIRSGSTTLIALPVRPELRRGKNALIVSSLLIPVAILAVTMLTKALPALVSWDDIGLQGGMVSSPEVNTEEGDSPILYFAPAALLLLLAVGTYGVQVYEHLKAAKTARRLKCYIPVLWVVLVLIFNVAFLWAVAENQSQIFTLTIITLATIVLPFAIVVDWLTTTLSGTTTPAWFPYRVTRYATILVLCIAAVLGGLTFIIGVEMTDSANRDDRNTSEAVANVPEGSSVGEPPLRSPAPAEDTLSVTETEKPERTDPLWPLTIFFVLVGTLTVSGIWLSNTMLSHLAAVAGYVKAVHSVAKCVVPKSMHSEQSVRANLIDEISDKLGDALPRTHAIEFADYLQAVNPAKRVTTTCPADGPLNPWITSALQGGIDFACDRSATEQGSYYAIYLHVVEGVSGQLYDHLADCGESSPTALSPDTLVAAKRMCEEVADLFYRCKLASVAQKHARKALESV